MNLLIQLYLSFLKIGLFGFGGGYAMISLIQDELVQRGWLSIERYIDIIAIAEITPGPIAINSGTFVGFSVSSFWGAFFATLGVITPSFVLVILLARFFGKVKDSPHVNAILQLLRPAVIGLILAAAFSFGKSNIIDWKSLLISITVFTTMLKTKINPIMLIILSGITGIIIF